MYTKNVKLPEGITSIQSHEVTINNLKDITDVEVDQGKVEISKIEGDVVHLILSGGSSTRKEQVGGAYTAAHSKEVKETKTASNTSFANTLSYDSEGYKGVLNKLGDYKSRVVSGHYESSYSYTESTSLTQSHTSFPNSVTYNSGGYYGTLYKSGSYSSRVVSGDYYPASSKTGTARETYDSSSSIPSTYYYNDGTYSGTLSKYGSPNLNVIGTKTIPGASKTVTVSTGTWGWGYTCGANGIEWKDPAPQSHSAMVYSQDGYKGTLTWSYNMIPHPSDGAICQNGKTPQAMSKYMAEGFYSGTVKKDDTVENVYSYTQAYSGTVTSQAYDTRVWEYTQSYSGTVTSSGYDTRVWEYSQEYSGTVTKPESDTRQWKEYYQYNVSIEYDAIKIDPTLANAFINSEWKDIKKIRVKVDNKWRKVIGSRKKVDGNWK